MTNEQAAAAAAAALNFGCDASSIIADADAQADRAARTAAKFTAAALAAAADDGSDKAVAAFNRDITERAARVAGYALHAAVCAARARALAQQGYLRMADASANGARMHADRAARA